MTEEKVHVEVVLAEGYKWKRVSCRVFDIDGRKIADHVDVPVPIEDDND